MQSINLNYKKIKINELIFLAHFFRFFNENKNNPIGTNSNAVGKLVGCVGVVVIVTIGK